MLRFIPLLAVALALGTSACASVSHVALQRGDWVRSHTAYVEHEEQLGGESVKVLSPAPEAEEAIMTQDEAAALTPGAFGALRGGTAPPRLEALETWTAPVGAIAEAQGEEPIDAVSVSADAPFEAWWTVPHTVHRFEQGDDTETSESTVFLRCARTGTGEVVLTRAGQAQRIAVVCQ